METLVYKLPVFEGPLDMLLTLISKNKLNIYDINISELLEQYMKQIELMQENRMDITSEFLEMASRLVYIKSAMLLPKHEEGEQLRRELTGELLEYRTCKEMAQKLSTMTEGFGTFVRKEMKIEADKLYKRSHAPEELLSAYASAVGRGLRRLPPPVDTFTPLVAKRIVSVASRVINVLRRLRVKSRIKFKSLFENAESRSEVVATFLAVLELIKAKRITVSGEKEKMTVSICGGEKSDAEQCS